MKALMKNPATFLIGITCLTSVYAQGYGDAVEASQQFNERAANDIRAFKQRYQDRGPLVVPEDSEWAAPTDDHDITVRKAVWDEFSTGLTTNMRENPMWYMLRAAHLLRYFSRDAEVMAQGIYQTTQNAKWLQFRDEYFEIIAPLMTEFTWEQPDPKKPGNFFQTKHQNLPTLPRGLFDRAGLFDSSFAPDPFNDTLADGAPNTYPHDTIALKIALAKLFQPRTEDFDGQPLVTVSDTRFIYLWTTIKEAYDRLAPLTKRLAKAVNKEKWKLGDPGGAATKKLDMRPRQTREYKRAEAGYENYYEKFWEEFDAYDEHEDPSKWMQSEWVIGLLFGHRLNIPNTTNVFVAYGIMVTTVYHSVLALMMDMMADIALRANIVARSSVASINPTWALPQSPEFSVSLATVEKYPEWTDGMYRTTGYPIPDQVLPMVLPLFQQQREERNRQYELWAQERDARRQAALDWSSTADERKTQ
ncbi:hypothetical protein TWF730_011092 [Orbilia blumenaviensis]|uniref:Uncharacterized protein n=1 Tax=Orbilia blumenaviensis TaxID=1796055 RepID=A0AAV9UN50_9PEZI